LIEQVATAIAHPEHSYQVLAPILITEIQKAREQVLRGHADAITVSPELERLLLPQPQKLTTSSPTPILSETTHTNSKFNPMSNNLSNSDHPQRHFEGGDSTKKNNHDLENNPTWGEDKRAAKPTYNSGPEVGAAELNTLADLFEGESSYFDENWEGEEVGEEANTGEGTRETLPPDPGELLSPTHDFDDLLFEDPSGNGTSMSSPDHDEEDLGNLFGLEGFVEMEDSSISDNLRSPALVEPLKSSNQKLDDLGDLFEEVATEELKEPDDWEHIWDDEPLDAVSEIASPAPEEEFSLEIADDSDFRDLLEISGFESGTEAEGDSFEPELATEIPIDEEDFDDLFGETTEDEADSSTLTASEESVDWFDSDPSSTVAIEDDLTDLFELDTAPSPSIPAPIAPVTPEKPAPTSGQSDEFWLDFEDTDSEPQSEVLEALDGLFDDEPPPESVDLDLMEESSLDSELFGEELAAEDDSSNLFEESPSNLDGEDWNWDLDPESSEDNEDTSDFYQNLESLFDEPTGRSPNLDVNQTAPPPQGPSKATESGAKLASPADLNLDFEELFGPPPSASPMPVEAKPVSISEPIRERLDLPPSPQLTQGADVF
ncbi:MAG: hypothetical protein ACRC8Y_26775, partial [Chroococcales cyanobacterium]